MKESECLSARLPFLQKSPCAKCCPGSTEPNLRILPWERKAQMNNCSGPSCPGGQNGTFQNFRMLSRVFYFFFLRQFTLRTQKSSRRMSVLELTLSVSWFTSAHGVLWPGTCLSSATSSPCSILLNPKRSDWRKGKHPQSFSMTKATQCGSGGRFRSSGFGFSYSNNSLIRHQVLETALSPVTSLVTISLSKLHGLNFFNPFSWSTIHVALPGTWSFIV